MPSAGPNIAGAGAEIAGDGDSWSSPGNVTANDGSVASITVTSGNASNRLYSSTFNFNITSQDQIDGIECTIDVTAISGVQANEQFIAQLTLDGSIVEGGIRNIPKSVGLHTVGGSTDTWSNTFFGSDVSSSTFGVFITLTDDSAGCSVSIDYISLTLYYSTPWVPEQNSTYKLFISTTGMRW